MPRLRKKVSQSSVAGRKRVQHLQCRARLVHQKVIAAAEPIASVLQLCPDGSMLAAPDAAVTDLTAHLLCYVAACLQT
jgi:hypothetical protein